MLKNRSSGILLHPTSLPGQFGIGDLGGHAFEWVNFLEKSGCGYWQILPLGPTGYGDSPYQCFSAFAGNPYLINPEPLLGLNLLTREEIENHPSFPSGWVNFGEVIPWKLSMLQIAFNRYQRGSYPDVVRQIEQFTREENYWLHDYALFMTIKDLHHGVAWNHWPEPLRFREKEALQKIESDHKNQIDYYIFQQFMFSEQWRNLRRFANEKGIQIIGDIPIYVSYDSADSWAHPELFMFDGNGLPTVVSGTPPDLFSSDGQLWGNPIYRWEVHNKTGYEWWIQRIKTTLKSIDLLRLDHFRGFAGYWSIPAGDTTARNGIWMDGPGMKLFLAIRKQMGDLPIIAEDLGEITQDVFVLRDLFNLPGMKVIQFAFFDPPDPNFLPHNYEKNFIAYTGTHDNDTAVGWFNNASEASKQHFSLYTNSTGENVAWDMIRSVWASVADLAIAPLQDFLSLGNEARMNYPGRSTGNWGWRVDPGSINQDLAHRIRQINQVFGRLK